VEHIASLSSIGLGAMSGPIDVFNLAIQQQMNKSRALQCTGLMLLLQSILYNYHFDMQWSMLACFPAFVRGPWLGSLLLSIRQSSDK
jgi:hypothetical protein